MARASKEARAGAHQPSSSRPRTSKTRQPPLPDVGQTECSLVIGALGPSPVDIDEVICATGVETRKVHSILLELYLARRLQRHGRQLVLLTEP